MISMDTAYSWLNIADRTHLTAANNLSILQIDDKFLPPEHREAVIHSLRVACESSRDILETLEVKLTLAKICFKNQDYAAAKIDLLDAVKRYKPASHRLGVSKWMLGILLWELRDHESAYFQWAKAKEIFIGLAQTAVRSRDIKLVNWYYEKKDDMSLDLCITAEEAFYNWLNYFERTSLSEAGKLFAAEISKKIQKKEFPLAYEIGVNLARISHNRINTIETAEAWVVIGLAALQMGNPRLAVDYLQRGAAAFSPWGHKQAVTRWMIGIAQWQIPEEIDQAIKNWTNAIEAFKELRRKADQENNQDKKDWYEGTTAIMTRAIKNKVSPSIGR
jgi:tetratricopeptide (TPR) repeat protein